MDLSPLDAYPLELPEVAIFSNPIWKGLSAYMERSVCLSKYTSLVLVPCHLGR